MKIIDNKKDYYDYCQYTYPDTLVTFDRRGSVILNKDNFINILSIEYSYGRFHEHQSKSFYVLLKIGYSNWVFALTVIPNPKYQGYPTEKKVSDFSVELFHTWKDYTRPGFLFDFIDVTYTITEITSKKDLFSKGDIFAFEHNNFTSTDKLSACLEGHYPIFKDTFIPSFIKPETLYIAFDEYFSHLKDDKTVDKMSDLEKRDSHGFDKKSFKNC